MDSLVVAEAVSPNRGPRGIGADAKADAGKPRPMMSRSRRPERSSDMDNKELIDAVRRLSVETGSLACLGCGWEHNCSIHGCAILRAVIAELSPAANADL